MARGTLFLVVGPSGAGKDTLIAHARAKLEPRGFVFPRREITREPHAGDSENHIAQSATAFDARERAGLYALTWQAHGLSYGIPASIAVDLANGRPVVANVSRTVVSYARATFPPVRVIMVTAAPEVLAARLASRAREAGNAIDTRIRRTVAVEPDVTIVNDGPIEDALAAFLAALTG